jgi:hypothetical protein
MKFVSRIILCVLLVPVSLIAMNRCFTCDKTMVKEGEEFSVSTQWELAHCLDKEESALSAEYKRYEPVSKFAALYTFIAKKEGQPCVECHDGEMIMHHFSVHIK